MDQSAPNKGSVYFKVFTSWPGSRMAAWPQKKIMSTYPGGCVAATPNKNPNPYCVRITHTEIVILTK